MVELIAHRAGNSIAGIEPFRSIAVGIEVDVHLDRGRLVVRHAKRVWFTSRLWDRWYLLPPDTRVPLFADMLEWAGSGTELWVDCKGATSRLPEELARVVVDRGLVTLSSKSWWILRRLSGRSDVRTIRSVGNRFELLLLRFLPSRVAFDGVVVHRRLLTASLVTELRHRWGLVFSWSIGDERVARRLVSWGVDGLIIDKLEILVALTEPGVELDQAGSDNDGDSETEESKAGAEDAIDDVVVCGDDNGYSHEEGTDHGEGAK